MIDEIDRLDPQTLSRFDEIIDVRSPSEFAEDHMPGAVNLPVLDDAQRAEVGTLYVQKSKFLASRVGAAHVARSIAEHLEGHLADKPGSYAPLIYCWRGGNRSGAMATILSRVGWRTGVIKGGYRTYRRDVVAKLYDGSVDAPLVLLSGPTGSGKTALLGAMAERGAQTLDLEALAAHRGSLFGAEPGRDQPSQKAFESALCAALARLDMTRPIVLEAESSRIGALTLPPALWRPMTAAPRIELSVPAPARARHLAAGYADWLRDLDDLRRRVERMPRHHSRAVRDHWMCLAQSGEAEAFAMALIEAHYDPTYRRAAADQGPTIARLHLGQLTDAAVRHAADTLSRLPEFM
jgi:tRNA 2-selenouridine synthase